MQTYNNIAQKIIGYILLSPALISVLLFFAQLFSQDELSVVSNLDWTVWSVGDGAGYTSVLPLYFGLMAIAGAYLIKDSKK